MLEETGEGRKVEEDVGRIKTGQTRGDVRECGDDGKRAMDRWRIIIRVVDLTRVG